MLLSWQGDVFFFWKSVIVTSNSWLHESQLSERPKVEFYSPRDRETLIHGVEGQSSYLEWKRKGIRSRKSLLSSVTPNTSNTKCVGAFLRPATNSPNPWTSVRCLTISFNLILTLPGASIRSHKLRVQSHRNPPTWTPVASLDHPYFWSTHYKTKVPTTCS